MKRLHGGKLLVTALALLAPRTSHAGDFDYSVRYKSFFIKGWVENQYSFSCGAATKEHIQDVGYVSLYQHDYWLLGQPHKTWNFEIQTEIQERSFVWADIIVDGQFFTRYGQRMRVDSQAVSSDSDLCNDRLGGYCPEQSTVAIMDDLIGRLKSAHKLSFVLYDGNRTESHEIDISGWMSTQSAIDACLGNLAIRTSR